MKETIPRIAFFLAGGELSLYMGNTKTTRELDSMDIKRDIRLVCLDVFSSLDNQHSLPDFQTVVFDTQSFLY